MEDLTMGLGVPVADRRGDWCQVWPRGRFWPLDPRPEEIEIETVAHALSMMCRFGGHVSEFYSVAEHSVRVAGLVEVHAPEHVLWALLHDAPEAFIADLVRPIKHQPEYAEYRRHEAEIMRAVCVRFGLPQEMPEVVRWADETLLATEARDLIGPHVLTEWRLAYPPLAAPVEPWYCDQAKRAYLECFALLTEGAK